MPQENKRKKDLESLCDGKVHEVDVELIKVPADRVTSVWDDPEVAEEFYESVKERGILVPLSCLLVNGTIWLIDGLHRLDAAKKLGIKKVPALIRQGDEIDLLTENLIMNRQRGKSNPAQEAKLVKVLHDKHGFTYRDIAKKLGMSVYTTKLLYDANKLPERVLQYVGMGKITVKKAVMLLQIPEPRDQIKACEDIIRYGYNEQQTKALIRYFLEAYNDVADTVPQVVLQKPEAESFMYCELCHEPMREEATYHWVCPQCWAKIEYIFNELKKKRAEKETE